MDTSDHHSPTVNLDLQFSHDLVPQGQTDDLLDLHNLGFGNHNVHCQTGLGKAIHVASTTRDNPSPFDTGSNSMLRDDAFLHFPLDSGFNFHHTMKPFNIEHGPTRGDPVKKDGERRVDDEALHGISMFKNDFIKGEFSGDEFKGRGQKKRKRPAQSTQDKGVSRHLDQIDKVCDMSKENSVPHKVVGKHSKARSQQASDVLKKDYIHVRARSGQATNKHCLAERARREKINDRLEYLQELVPGGNKITGKAVVLDATIKYVLSLQGQVEFLSMKLAAVNGWLT